MSKIYSVQSYFLKKKMLKVFERAFNMDNWVIQLHILKKELKNQKNREDE